jgi:hypothetical protein
MIVRGEQATVPEPVPTSWLPKRSGMRSIWQSERDCCQLVWRCSQSIEA